MAERATGITPLAPAQHFVSVTIGILTYQRPEAVVATLSSLRTIAVVDSPQPPARAWRLTEVLVIDNDHTPSAAEAVAAFEEPAAPIRYVHEPEPGLAAARNRALDETTTDVLVFIDDDEQAGDRWPGALLEVLTGTGAAMVGGPVISVFREDPPAWVVSGGYLDRQDPEHGAIVEWLRSGNLAVDLAQIRAIGLRFDDAFAHTGGEDAAFSRTAAHRCLQLRWSAFGEVTEDVGPERTTLRWLARRYRRASTAYVRAELLNDRSLRRLAWVTARGTGRCTQGVLTVLLGLVTLQSARVYSGLIIGSKGVGLLEGLVDHRAIAYGHQSRPSPLED